MANPDQRCVAEGERAAVGVNRRDLRFKIETAGLAALAASVVGWLR